MYYISYYFNEINFFVIRGRKPITRERSVFCIIFFYLVTYLFINVQVLLRVIQVIISMK